MKMIELQRRSFLKGVGSLFAAPAIVRIESLMPIRALIVPELIVPEFVPQNLLTISMINSEAIKLFTNSNAFIKHMVT